MIDWKALGITCPNCGNPDDGIDGGTPFRIAEYVQRSWEPREEDPVDGTTLFLDTDTDEVDWDSANGEYVVECRNCLREFPIPNSLVIDFV